MNFIQQLGSYRNKFYVCFSDNLGEFFNSWNHLKLEDDMKVMWVINNTGANCTLYQNMIYMGMMMHLDGIIVIDDNPNDLFSICSRRSDELVLRINSTEAEKLKKYDLHKHFEAFKKRHEGETFNNLTKTEIIKLIQEYLFLDKEEIESSKLSFSYSREGTWANWNGDNLILGRFLNIYTIIFFLWVIAICWWIYKNKKIFLIDFIFEDNNGAQMGYSTILYGYRVIAFSGMKLLQLFICMILVMYCFYPHERVMYMENRGIFEILIWTSIILKQFSYGTILSLMYSISKDITFVPIDKWNDIYVLSLIVLPLWYILGDLLSFVLMFQLNYLYFGVQLYIFISITISSFKQIYEARRQSNQ